VSWFVRAEPGVWARSDAAYHWLAGTRPGWPARGARSLTAPWKQAL